MIRWSPDLDPRLAVFHVYDSSIGQFEAAGADRFHAKGVKDVCWEGGVEGPGVDDRFKLKRRLLFQIG